MNLIPDNLRNEVEARAGGFCEYCRIPVKGQVAQFPIDHIIPRGRGGATVSANLAVACPRCNGHKWVHLDGKDPSSGELVRLFHPRLDRWHEHFAWSTARQLELEGKTAIGRATIARLCINDSEMITIRRLLVELGIMSIPDKSRTS